MLLCRLALALGRHQPPLHCLQGLGAPNLTSYRRRAKALLERLESRAKSTDIERKRALGELSVGLRALVEDLQSVDAPRDYVERLEALLKSLTGVAGRADLGGDELDALWSESVAGVRAFAEGRNTGGEATTPSGRGEFWK